MKWVSGLIRQWPGWHFCDYRALSLRGCEPTNKEENYRLLPSQTLLDMVFVAVLWYWVLLQKVADGYISGIWSKIAWLN